MFVEVNNNFVITLILLTVCLTRLVNVFFIFFHRMTCR